MYIASSVVIYGSRDARRRRRTAHRTVKAASCTRARRGCRRTTHAALRSSTTGARHAAAVDEHHLERRHRRRHRHGGPTSIDENTKNSRSIVLLTRNSPYTSQAARHWSSGSHSYEDARKALAKMYSTKRRSAHLGYTCRFLLSTMGMPHRTTDAPRITYVRPSRRTGTAYVSPGRGTRPWTTRLQRARGP